eukprot:scaffold178350_cov23-Tisochrysis_lutea.AAC.2
MMWCVGGRPEKAYRTTNRAWSVVKSQGVSCCLKCWQEPQGHRPHDVDFNLRCHEHYDYDGLLRLTEPLALRSGFSAAE